MNRSQTLRVAITIIFLTVMSFLVWDSFVEDDEPNHRVKTIDGIECLVSGPDDDPEIHSCAWETNTTWAD